MPTKKESMTFVRKFKGALKEAGLKSPSTMSSGELQKSIDSAVEKLPKDVSNEWKRMKLKSDISPEDADKLSKTMKKEQLKKGTLGKSAPIPKLARDKKKSKPKAVAKVKMTAPGMTTLPPKSMVEFDIGQAMKKGKFKIKKKD